MNGPTDTWGTYWDLGPEVRQLLVPVLVTDAAVEEVRYSDGMLGLDCVCARARVPLNVCRSYYFLFLLTQSLVSAISSPQH